MTKNNKCICLGWTPECFKNYGGPNYCQGKPDAERYRSKVINLGYCYFKLKEVTVVKSDSILYHIKLVQIKKVLDKNGN